MIVKNIFVPAIFIATYLVVVDATRGLSSSRRNELDAITPLTEEENDFLVTLFNRGIFKLSENSESSDQANEPQTMRRRLSSKKSKKSSGSTDSDSRRHAHKLEHTT